MKKPRAFVSDADAMIDFVTAAREVVPLIAQHLAPIFMPQGVFQEIEKLDRALCRKLKIQVYEPILEEAAAAALLSHPRSPNDRMCLHLGIRHERVVVTNDKQLRLCCANVGVTTTRGLGLLKSPVDRDIITPAIGIKHATAIHKANPLYITAQLVEEFTRSLTGR